MSTAPAPPAGNAAPGGAPRAHGQAEREQAALAQALAQLLAPVARLAVARGLPFAAAEEMLKRAFVQAASAAHPGLPAHRKVSRIATSTGINRREVTRLTVAAGPPAKAAGLSSGGAHSGAGPAAEAGRASHASQLCAHWRSHAAWRGADGQPLALPRLGPAPSFEALAQQITRDVHARSLLDELVRLQLARLDEAADTVWLLGDATVPSGDRVRMLGVLGANVSDHLRAAVDNVLAAGQPPHLEQALFAEGLSGRSLEELRPLLRQQWVSIREALVPELERRIEADAAAAPAAPAAAAPGAPPTAGLARVRLGLYVYQEVPGAEVSLADPLAPAVPVKARRPKGGVPAGASASTPGTAPALPRRAARSARPARSARSAREDSKP